MRYSFFIGAFAVISCFSVVAVPVSEVVELNGVQCSPLKVSGKWKTEIGELLYASDIAGEPYLTRVSNDLDKVSQAQVSSQGLRSVLLNIGMSICHFPIKYQPVLRRVLVNLTLRAAMEGEKYAIYAMMDTYPSQRYLSYIYVKEEGRELSVGEFSVIREYLEEADIDEVYDTEQLKEIVKNALSKAKSVPNSLPMSPREDSPREVHSDSEILSSL